MGENEMAMVPLAVLEDANARAERRDKRQWVIILILIASLLLSNIGWIIYEMQYVNESVMQEIDTGDGDAVVAGIGDAYYGENQADG